MDAMISTAALASAEKMINAALVYDPGSRIALAALAPQVLAIKLTAPEFTFFVAPDDSGIRLLGHCEYPITTQLQGTLPALISLAKHDRINLKDSGVELIGNSLFLADLQKIFKNLDIDWEEILSKIFGDLLGHQGAAAIRQKMTWAKDRANNIQRLTSEFLTEELRALPSKSELEFFYSQVDELKLDVDRIEARIEQLIMKNK